MANMLYKGKVKEVWSTEDPDIIEFRYTDQISVFDQIIPSLVPRKGESLNRTSCHWFKLVEDANICETHIIEMNAPDRVLARRFDVVREPGQIPRDMENVFVPLEVICRHYLAGGGWRRYERGDVGPEEFGFEPGTVLHQGVKLPKPYLEVSTKFEKFDRLLDRDEALEISNLREEEFDAILDIVVKIDEIIDKVLPKSSRSDFLYSPLAEINNDPSKIRLTPKIRYAKFSNCKSPVIPPGLIIPMGA